MARGLDSDDEAEIGYARRAMYRMLICLLGAAIATVATAEDGPPAAPSVPWSRMEGRMLKLPSAEVWGRVRAAIDGLGLEAEQVAPELQVLRTRWYRPGHKKRPWLEPPTLPPGYERPRVQFLVYVSPFVEPARLYVGSALELERSHSGKALAYNVRQVNLTLMTKLEEALGQQGFNIPADRDKRAELQLALREGRFDCTTDLPPGDVDDDDITHPRKIKVSEYRIQFTNAAMKAHEGGEVRLKLIVTEDGTVAGLEAGGEPIGFDLEKAAAGPLSLLLYTPSRIKGCPVPTTITYTIDFKLHR